LQNLKCSTHAINLLAGMHRLRKPTQSLRYSAWQQQYKRCKTMTQQTLMVDGVEVLVEGEGPGVVLMLHGWPDTRALWDGTVQALRTHHRCARFTLPGFDAAQPTGPARLADMTQLLARMADALSPGQPVTLLLHDWGCIFGYEFAARHPERVARMVAVDIGDHNSGAYLRSLSVGAKLQIAGYQLWLALAWLLGHVSATLGNHMTRWMAGAMRCPAPAAQLAWHLNFPYAMQWFGVAGGFGGAATVKLTPQHPLLYVYGARKPFMFHSPQWLQQAAAQPGSAVQAFATGHWVMLEQPQQFQACMAQWLAGGVAA
jgi:cis-3-alkyl-4-acyloxetan-2-one decarboxylase